MFCPRRFALAPIAFGCALVSSLLTLDAARGASPVTRALRLHLDASDVDAGNDGSVGDPAHNADVAVWGDKSGNGNALTAVSGRPLLLRDQVNGKPVVEFEAGADYLERNDVVGGLTGNPALDLFLVLDTEQNTDFFGLGTGEGGQTKHFSTRSIFWFNNGNQKFTSTPLASQGPVIGNFLAPPSATYGEHRFFRNGVEAAPTDTTNPDGSTDFPPTGNVTRLGAGIAQGGNASGDFSDRIAEVLVFGAELNEVERALVVNYLSAKYGITLEPGGEDLYGGDEIANGDFDEDVAGIGRLSGASVSEGISGGLRVSDAGYLTDDDDFLLFGHDAAANGWIPSDLQIAPNARSRMAREWYADVRDAGVTGGRVDLSVDFVAAGLSPPSLAETYSLLARPDPATGFREVVFGGTADGRTVAFEDVDVEAIAQRRLTIGSTTSVEFSAEAVISEFMAVNVFTLDDDEGDSSDWVEVHNMSAELGLELEGWYLTDDPRDLRKWAFPSGVVVGPDDYLVVFASGKDRAVPEQQLHTNFRLSSSGEYLALVLPDGETVVHDYSPSFPGQFQDVSYGFPAGLDAPTHLANPTPGAPNGDPASLGPVIAEPAHSPQVPRESDDIVVTGSVAELLSPVATVELTYRVLYDDESLPVPMRDDGGGPDATAGDGVYSAVIPSSAFSPGDMVRWFISATDTEGRATDSPRFLNPRASPQYHGTVVQGPSIESNLPVFHWFLRPGTESAANTRSGTRASVFFLDELYDNVFVRIRGGSTSGLAKKSYKFDFNPRHHFRFNPAFGRVSEININTTYTDKAYVRQALTLAIFDLAGAPGSESFLVRVERNGAFFSVATFIEQPDDDLLRREGLNDDGALYKMFNTFTSASSRVEKKNRRYEDNRDLAEFINSINGRSGESLARYVFDNVDIPRVLNYLAANILTQNNDSMAKNYYLYRDSDGSGEWLVLPWDVDLTFGRHFMTNDSILGDPIWADKDYVVGGVPPDTPISPSHPFMGMQELPGNRSWNRLIDGLFEVPEFAEMFRRRLRTLMDRLLQAPDTPAGELLLEGSLDETVDEIGADVLLDTQAWGQFGTRLTLTQAMDILKGSYLRVRRTHLFQTHLVDNVASYPERRAFSAELPRPQEPHPQLHFGQILFNPSSGNQDEEFLQLINPNDVAVDISGWRLTGGLEHTFKQGTVLLANGSLYLSPDVSAFRARSSSPRGDEGHLVQGSYAGHLSSLGETLCLLEDDGTTVSCITYNGNPSDPQLFLRVTELHFHPTAPTPQEVAAGFEDQDEFEFVELTNVSPTKALDLSDVKFSDGVDFHFGDGDIQSLAPGETAVVVSNRAAFQLRYGDVSRVAGEYWPTRLDNDGERLKLDDATNSTVQEFTYNDNAEQGWPAAADGAGPSLEIVDVTGDYSLGANWRASEQPHGTPGLYTGLPGQPPSKATGPQPGDGADEVAVTALLTWSHGERAERHQIYFGTTNPPAFAGSLVGSAFAPGFLARRTTYYWRVDEVNAFGVTTGDVWQFTTGTTAILPVFIRGDANLDGTVDISDAVVILFHLFGGGGDIACEDAGDVDNDEALNITDPIRVLNFLFLSGPAPEAPFPHAGTDPDGSGLLGCAQGLGEG